MKFRYDNHRQGRYFKLKCVANDQNVKQNSDTKRYKYEKVRCIHGNTNKYFTQTLGHDINLKKQTKKNVQIKK